jgi:hypothetical protein
LENFDFSDELRERIEEALVDRIADAWSSSINSKEYIRSGFPGVEEMSSVDLMDEYMNWHGAYSIEECPDDDILCKMFKEVESYEFEKQVLKEEA